MPPSWKAPRRVLHTKTPSLYVLVVCLRSWCLRKAPSDCPGAREEGGSLLPPTVAHPSPLTILSAVDVGRNSLGI